MNKVRDCLEPVVEGSLVDSSLAKSLSSRWTSARHRLRALLHWFILVFLTWLGGMADVELWRADDSRVSRSVNNRQNLTSSASISARDDFIAGVYTLDAQNSSDRSDFPSGGLKSKSKFERSMVRDLRLVNGIIRSRMMQHHHRRLRQFLEGVPGTSAANME